MRQIGSYGGHQMNRLPIQGIKIDWSLIDTRSYLRKIDALYGVEQLMISKPVTFFVGENGSGKSTLLEAMAVALHFNPEGGSKNYSFSTKDTHSELCDALTIVRGVRRERWGYFLRAESFYNVATMEEVYAQNVNMPSEGYHERSHGESFLHVMQNNLGPNGLYLLDEPEAALSPQKQLSLMIEINRCIEHGAQFFIATHSPIILGFPNAEILSFDNGRIHPLAYEETENYQITKYFLNHRERVLKELFL